MTLTLKQLIKLGVVTPIRRRRYRARKQIMRDNRNTGDYIPPVVRSVSEMRGSSNIISPNQGSASFIPYTDVMRIRDEQQQQFIRQQEQKRDLEAQRIALEDYQQEQQGKFEKAGEAFKYVFSRLPSWENDTYGNFGEVEGSDSFQVRGMGVSQGEKEKQALMYTEPFLSAAGGGAPFLQPSSNVSSPRSERSFTQTTAIGREDIPLSKLSSPRQEYPSSAVGGGMAVSEENVKPSEQIKKIEERVQSQRGGLPFLRMRQEISESEEEKIPEFSTTRKNYIEIGGNPDDLKGLDKAQAFGMYKNILKSKIASNLGDTENIENLTARKLRNKYNKAKQRLDETIARSNVEYISAPKPSPKPSR